MSGSLEITKILAMSMVLGEGEAYIDGKSIGKVKSVTMTDKKGRPPTKRRQTCPICGEKNVNIYPNSRGTWMCRKCKEEYP